MSLFVNPVYNWDKPEYSNVFKTKYIVAKYYSPEHIEELSDYVNNITPKEYDSMFYGGKSTKYHTIQSEYKKRVYDTSTLLDERQYKITDHHLHEEDTRERYAKQGILYLILTNHGGCTGGQMLVYYETDDREEAEVWLKELV